MSTEVDVSNAMREASRAFRRDPIRFALPLVLFGLAQEGEYLLLGRARGGFHWWIIGFALILCVLMNSLFELLAIEMFLSTQRDRQPRFAQLKDVLAFPGLAGYASRLLTVYVGWMLVGLTALFVAVVVLFGLGLHPGASAGGYLGMSISLVLAGLMLVVAAFMARYNFVLPVLVFARGDRAGLFAYGVERAVSVWVILAMLAVIQITPVAIQIAFAPLTRDYWALHVPLGYALRSVWLILLNALYVWFILVRAALALQIMPPPLEARSASVPVAV